MRRLSHGGTSVLERCFEGKLEVCLKKAAPSQSPEEEKWWKLGGERKELTSKPVLGIYRAVLGL